MILVIFLKSFLISFQKNNKNIKINRQFACLFFMCKKTEHLEQFRIKITKYLHWFCEKSSKLGIVNLESM